MEKFNVKIDGPTIDKYRFLREQGIGIQEAKKISKPNPSTFSFDNFDDFTNCVKFFHREPFKVETDCDFDYHMDEFAGTYTPTEDDVEIEKELSDENYLNNIKEINAIIHWQQSSDKDKFICGNDENHGILFPGLDIETNTVVMGCPNCDYIMKDIPEIVLKYYNNYLKKDKK